MLVVHHSGKADSSIERGSRALRAAADTMLKVEFSQDAIEIIVDKQKDAEAAAPVFLQLVPQGESCALAPAAEHKTLSKHAKTILEVLARNSRAAISQDSLRSVEPNGPITINLRPRVSRLKRPARN